MSTGTILLLLGGAAVVVWAMSTGRLSVATAQGSLLQNAVNAAGLKALTEGTGAGVKNASDVAIAGITAGAGLFGTLAGKVPTGGTSGSSGGSDPWAGVGEPAAWEAGGGWF